jgi:hypothetical protein
MTRDELEIEYERLQQENTALKAKEKYLEAQLNWFKEQMPISANLTVDFGVI